MLSYLALPKTWEGRYIIPILQWRREKWIPGRLGYLPKFIPLMKLRLKPNLFPIAYFIPDSTD